ncbi:MAG: o-succinylbenzoate synthase [Melioribacteraceae bacterium]|nr:o-succinylbenzoate synthase [Melioribacteraceae bacterium]
MKIESVKWKIFDYNLNTPLINSKGIIKTRKGFLIQIKTDSRMVGYGEASPLPFFGKETFEETERSILLLNSILPGTQLNNAKFPFHFLAGYNLTPSVRFAVEQCLTEIKIRSNDLNFSEKTVLVNGLIGSTTIEESLNKTKKFIEKGFKTIKIKVGQNCFNDELKLIDSVSCAANNGIKIKLDVNGAWPLNDAIMNIKKLAQYNIEYIEQPCTSINDLIKLSQVSSIPIAADESLADMNDFNLLCEQSDIKHFIVKPTLFGGMANTLDIIEQTESKGMTAVISSALENTVAASYLILLASFLPNTVHGLGTIDLVTPVISKNLFPIKNGQINFRTGKLLNNPAHLIND